MMDVRRPTYLDINPDAYSVNLMGMGEACVKSSWLVPMAVGAVAMYMLPPFLSGMISGAREELGSRHGRR